MSKLEELIEQLCSDGVEYKTLGDVATISRGGNFQKKDFTEQGKPCIHYGQIYTRYGLFTDKTLTFINDECFAKQKYAEPNDIIMAVTSENIEDICKCVAWLGSEKVAVSGHSAIIHHSLEPKYLTYFFHSQHFFNQKRKLAHGTKVMEVTPDTLKSIKLPVPPLEVQREIVRILDNFTFLTTELAAELAARQKQYEYYRDLLLTFKPNESTILNERTNELELSGAIRWMKLGDTCVLKAGKAISATEISQNVNDDYIYPCYGGNGLRGYVKNYNQDGKHPLIGRQGALCGNVCYAYDKFYATEHAVVVSPSDLYNEKFLYYLLDFAKLEQYKTAGAQPGLSVARLEKIILPVPPLEQQQRIVDILDRFETLCNDISSGLPAEIEARQKQYEYYRDKLLTFKELKKEA